MQHYLESVDRKRVEGSCVLVEEDILAAHYEKMKILKEEVSSWKGMKESKYFSFLGGEEFQASYVFGEPTAFGYPQLWNGHAFLFFTNKRIIYYDRSRMSDCLPRAMDLQDQESVIGVRELGSSPLTLFSLYGVTKRNVPIPRLKAGQNHAFALILTNKRILVVDVGLNMIWCSEAPMEEGETIKSQLGSVEGDFFIVTDRKLVYLKGTSLLKGRTSRIFNRDEQVSVMIVPRKKGVFSSLKSPYELTIRAGTETIKCGIRENELTIAREIEAMFSKDC